MYHSDKFANKYAVNAFGRVWYANVEIFIAAVLPADIFANSIEGEMTLRH
jgi:hypothetical protein